jgi:SWI/SNF-related matrix-associated actin-dependent regulator of chromatin subfamily A3
MTPAQIKAHEEAIRKQQESLRKAAELKSMLNNLEKVDDDGRRESLLDTLCSTDDILNLPLHPDPPGMKNGQLMVDLLKHQVRCGLRRNVLCLTLKQSQALQWCIEREYPVLPKKESDKPVQFWQMRLKPNKQVSILADLFFCFVPWLTMKYQAILLQQ